MGPILHIRESAEQARTSRFGEGALGKAAYLVLHDDPKAGRAQANWGRK
jgi:hypothetical protein